MNLSRLLADYSIPHVTSDARGGWVELRCVWCDDRSQNLGYSLANDFFNCWRCGSHQPIATLARILRVRENEAREIASRYGGTRKGAAGATVDRSVRVGKDRRPFRFPPSTDRMGKSHRRYLERRGFDPDEIEGEWNVHGTGPIARMDGIDYRHRLVIPIDWEGRTVSFTSRDVTDRHRLRYLTCPTSRELVPHRSILYGREESWTETVILVEGVADVWRLGGRALATFGIKVTHAQLRTIVAQGFRRVHVLFDFEPQALSAAARLRWELRGRGIEAPEWKPPKGWADRDPGSLPPDDARALVRDLTGSV